MRRPTRSTLATAAAAVLVLAPGLAGGPASAADAQVGQTFTDGSPCDTGTGQTATVIQVAGATAAVAAPGVITSWRAAVPGNAAGTLSLRTARSLVITGTSAPAALVSSVPVQQSTRIPVKAGDNIGFALSGSYQCGRQANGSASVVANSDVPVGGTVTGASAPFELNIAATVEPDADGDGFGDTTQDKCPTKATTQAECTPPVTQITKASAKKAKVVKGKAKKAKVTVTFTTSEPATSSCAVDGGAAKACSSPFRFKAKPGKHTVSVISTDVGGNVGAAATTTVKVKKKGAGNKK